MNLTRSELLCILQMRPSLRGTYLLWRAGIDPRYTMARETYHKHKIELLNSYQVDITTLPQ